MVLTAFDPSWKSCVGGARSSFDAGTTPS